MSSQAKRFNELYAAHGEAIADYCGRRMSVDEVDDAVADVFSVAWRKIDDVPDGADALPWLYAVAYRVVFHHWRSGGRRTRLARKAAGATADESVDTAEIVVQREDHRRVLQAATRLPHNDLEILRLTLWEELSLSDIATILGITHNATKQRLHRAKRRLAREYRSVTRTGYSPNALTQENTR